jgi:tryptophan synthase beta subunit
VSSSFIDETLKALRAEEQQIALETGRGKHGTDPVTVAKRIGMAMGLAKAQEIVAETAKRVAKENDE